MTTKPHEYIECPRSSATHLLHEDGRLVEIKSALLRTDLGHGRYREEDLIDRGHPGWTRVRKKRRGE
jgi:hypothetical protein